MKTKHTEQHPKQRPKDEAALVKVPLISQFPWFRRTETYNNEQAYNRYQ